MSDATIRAAIKALMNTVTGIGIVHDYSRWADDEAGLEALFLPAPNQPLHGWEISRESVQDTRFAGDKYKVVHGYVIRGHYALKDSTASEKAFNLVVDAIRQKFIDSRLANTEGHTLPQISIREWMFADVLCHRAEIKLAVTEIVPKTAIAQDDLLKVAVGQYLDPDATWTMWTPDTDYALDAIVVPTVANGRKYKCTVAGVSDAAAEPAWPVVAGGVVVDGTANWTEDGATVAVNSEITL